MKKLFLKLIIASFLFFILSITAYSQVGSLTIYWDDQCLPAVNNTDHYYVEVVITRNIDGLPLCGISLWFKDEIPFNNDYYSFGELETCYCTDALNGYHVRIKVERHTYDHIVICDGIEEFDCDCSRLEPLSERVTMQ